jgi:hypothetical protein
MRSGVTPARQAQRAREVEGSGGSTRLPRLQRTLGEMSGDPASASRTTPSAAGRARRLYVPAYCQVPHRRVLTSSTGERPCARGTAPALNSRTLGLPRTACRKRGSLHPSPGRAEPCSNLGVDGTPAPTPGDRLTADGRKPLILGPCGHSRPWFDLEGGVDPHSQDRIPVNRRVRSSKVRMGSEPPSRRFRGRVVLNSSSSCRRSWGGARRRAEAHMTWASRARAACTEGRDSQLGRVGTQRLLAGSPASSHA